MNFDYNKNFYQNKKVETVILNQTEPTVLQLLSGLRYSGMEMMILSSAEVWKQLGWKLTVVGQDFEGGCTSELQRAGVEVHIIRNPRTLLGLSDFLRVLIQVKPDILHIHPESMHGPICLISRLTYRNLPIVKTIHSLFRFSSLNTWKRKLQHKLASLSGVFWISVSHDVAEHERRDYGIDSVVIENWISPNFTFRDETLKSRGLKRITLGLVGNCSSIKNHEVVLCSVAKLNQYEVLHIGDESLASNQEISLLDKLENRRQIKRYGASMEVSNLIADCDVLIIPSIVEGFSLTAAEALASGVPIVVSTEIGISWARDLPGTYFVSNEIDWNDFLGNHLPKEISRLKIQARDNFEYIRARFSPTRGVEQHVKLYRCLMGE